MLGSNLVLTAFRDKYNVMVDQFVYDVTLEGGTNSTAGTAGTFIRFHFNKKVIDIPFSSSLSDLSDVDIDNPLDGQTLVYNSTTNKWENQFPLLSTLGDVELTNPQPNDVLLYDGTNWINGISENNDYTSNIFINDGDTYTSSISTLDEILGLLAPAKPGNLSTKNLTVNPIYTTTPIAIIQTKTGTARTHITDDRTPLIQFNPIHNSQPSTNNGAFNAASGTLNATLIQEESTNDITSSVTNVITFTSSNDTGLISTDAGTNFSLNITNDFDYHFGVVGKLGFWNAFFSTVQILNNLSFYPNEQHNVSMTHSATGTTSLTFYIDDPQTPSISDITKKVSTTATGTTHISGVPTLIFNDPIRCEFEVIDAIKTFYTAAIANAQSTITNSVTTNESGIKVYDSIYNADLIPVVQTAKYTENLVMSLRGYNSKYQTSTTNNSAITTADISTTQIGKTMRVDTMSNETARKTSGSGQYPTSGYGSTYDSTESLVFNEELQMIGGIYRYPYLNHTTNFPVAGPDYSSLIGWRYVTFVIPITAAQNIEVNFIGSSGFTGLVNPNSTMESTIWRLNAKVEGVTGWVDGNIAYSSGNPNIDGDAAMVVAASSTTKKTITFGTATRTGNCYVRIGLFNTAKSIPVSFSGVTITVV